MIAVYGPQLSETEAQMALNNAMPGEKIAYYRGFLACDGRAGVLPHIRDRGIPERWCHRWVWEMVLRGIIDVTQKKNADNDYTYYMTKRKIPRPELPYYFPAQHDADRKSAQVIQREHLDDLTPEMLERVLQ